MPGYPLTYSRDLDGKEREAKVKAARSRSKKVDKSLNSVNTGSSWFLPVIVARERRFFLLDSGASRTIVSRAFYEALPEPKPKLNHTKVCFQFADGRTQHSRGVIHLPVEVYGRSMVLVCFVCDMGDIDCVLGMDAFVKESMITCFRSGRIWIGGDVNSEPNQMVRKTGDRLCYLRAVENIIIDREGSGTVEVGFGKIIPAKWNNTEILCTTHPELWSEKGTVVFDGVTKLSKGRTEVTLINSTDQILKIKRGQLIAIGSEIDGSTPYDRNVHHEEIPLVLASEGASCDDVHSEIKVSAEVDTNIELERQADEFEEEMDIINPPLVGDGTTPMGPGGILPEHLEELLNRSCQGLTEEQQRVAGSLISDYRDDFLDPNTPLTQTDAAVHYIDTQGSAPIRIPQRRVPPGRKHIIEEEVHKMLKQDLIKESDGPWSSPVVLVRKKDGTIRFCIDYRKLNKATRRDAYPLPRIDDNLEALRGKKYFCTLDLASGYWQIKVAMEDREKTAFATHLGLFEFNVMPYGLTNAPATFERVMDKALGKLIGDCCLLYLDDIIVFGTTFEEVNANIRLVLDKLSANKLKLKAKKCFLYSTSVNFLGHVVSQAGISCDPGKIEKVKNWPELQDKGDVRSFLGLTNYYKRFVKDYCVIAHPLMCLLRADHPWRWQEKESLSFEKLKEALCSAPILDYPSMDGHMIVDTDASNFAIGAVLSQVQEDGEEHVIMYGSRHLAGSQQNWCTTRRELFAIIFFVTERFSHYLTGRKFTLRTDHASLVWLDTFKEKASDGLARWLQYLEPFRNDMKIVHRAGKLHGNADALSRRKPYRNCPREECPERELEIRGSLFRKQKPPLSTLHVIQTRAQANIDFEKSGDAVVPSLSDEEIKEAQNSDPVLVRFVELLNENDQRPSSQTLVGEPPDVKILCQYWDEYRFHNGILYRIGKDQDDDWRLVASLNLRKTIMQLVHESKVAGHPGMTRMKLILLPKFYWPRMRADIESWVRCCRACAMSKKGPGKGKYPLQQELSGSPFERVSFDVIGPLPRTESGNRFILLAVDYFSKWVDAYALPNHQAHTVAETLATRWIAQHGVPQRLHCDNAPEFRGHVLKELKEMLGVRGTFTTPYRPQSNGLAERSNQTIENIIKCMIMSDREKWDTVLPYALMSYRATPNTSTGMSPNMLVYGRECYMPVDIIFGHTGERIFKRKEYGDSCYCSYVEALRDNLISAFERARQCSKESALRQKRAYDKNSAPRSFKPGDWVIYWHKAIAARTLSSGWTGPYVVVRKTSDVDYKIQIGPDEKPKYVHCDVLWLDPVSQDAPNWIRDKISSEINRMKDQQTMVNLRRQFASKFCQVGNGEVVASGVPDIPLVNEPDVVIGPIATETVASQKEPITTELPDVHRRRGTRLRRQPSKLTYALL